MGRIAIVTGGASGIGRALCRSMADRGAHVVVADLDGPAAKAVARDLDSRGPGSAVAAEVDVADADAVKHLVENTHGQHGRLDFLFNNAGIGVSGRPEELSLNHWEKLLDVNLWGVVHGCHVAYPLMLEQGFGHIVNTASLAGLIDNAAGMVAYGTAKHGVVGLSQALRAAGEDYGIKVHVVCPGVIDTPMLDKRDTLGLPTPPSAAALDRREFFADVFKKFYAPEDLAEDILAGIARDRPIIVAPRQARVAWRLARLFPRLAQKFALHGTRVARERVEAVTTGTA